MKTVLFDFDRTLIDTDALKEEQARRIALLLNKNITQVHTLMERYIASLASHLDFDIAEYAAFIHKEEGISAATIVSVYVKNPEYIKDFVYKDVLPTLTQLAQSGVTMGILSQANETSQRVKFEYSGVLPFMDIEQVYIVRRKTSEDVLSKIKHGSYVVDDDLAVVNELARKRPDIMAVNIDRKQTNVTTSVLHITTLDQIFDLL